jgi:hypothetical protein
MNKKKSAKDDFDIILLPEKTSEEREYNAKYERVYGLFIPILIIQCLFRSDLCILYSSIYAHTA